MPERRFNEDEVAAIFERASSAPPADSRTLQRTDGMTLAQLQEIGREVGIAPELITRAAASIDQPSTASSRSFLGLPIGVGRTVDLPRKLSDEEWERFVVDLRETFDARGVTKSEGSLRQWSNGNLQVLLEPTATGQRVRFRTIKGDARAMIGGGLTVLAFAGVSLFAMLTSAGEVDFGARAAMAAFAASGIAMLVFGAGRLPNWAKTRRQQMDELAERLTTRLIG